jgi:hypothetical protein
MVRGASRWHSPAGGFVLQMQAPGSTDRPITQEYIDHYGIEADAWFDREVFIEDFGMDKYMKEYGKIGKAGRWGAWEPFHKLMMGNGIVGILCLCQAPFFLLTFVFFVCGLFLCLGIGSKNPRNRYIGFVPWPYSPGPRKWS